LPEPDHAVAKDVAGKMGFESAVALRDVLSEQMRAIREAYLRILD